MVGGEGGIDNEMERLSDHEPTKPQFLFSSLRAMLHLKFCSNCLAAPAPQAYYAAQYAAGLPPRLAH